MSENKEKNHRVARREARSGYDIIFYMSGALRARGMLEGDVGLLCEGARIGNSSFVPKSNDKPKYFSLLSYNFHRKQKCKAKCTNHNCLVIYYIFFAHEIITHVKM